MSTYTPGSILRVAILGNLAGMGYMIARSLRNQGVRADLFLGAEEEDYVPPFAPNVRPPAGSDWVIRWDASGLGGAGGIFGKRSEKAMLKKLATEYHLVQAIGLAIGVAPAAGKPYVHLGLESDLCVLGIEESNAGKAFRKALAGASIVFYQQPEHITTLNQIGIRRSKFMPYPVQVSPNRAPLRPPNPALRIFHPMRIDWAELERERFLKSGDRLYRACARYTAEGGKLELVMVDRGQESLATRRAIDRLGLTGSVTWLPHLDRMELARQFLEADLVVDDFDTKSLGMIALEAMAAGRPVLGYVDLAAYETAYGEQPPILCARAEAEVHAALVQTANPAFRDQMAAAAHYWVWNHHREEAVGQMLLDTYVSNVLGVPAAQ